MTHAPMAPTPWSAARRVAYETGAAHLLDAVARPLADCDGATLAEDVRALTDLPAFPTSTVDGYAVRGGGPWRILGRVLAGHVADPLTADGTGTEIATGAMVPPGTTAVLRVEESTTDAAGLVSGKPRPEPEWREPGDEASRGDVLVPAGTPVSPAIMGLAAASGHEDLLVRRRPRAAVLVFGDELLTSGLPGDGRIRDSLGPQLPAWLTRLGAEATAASVIGPIEDTLDAHVSAIRAAREAGADLIVTTGGTMNGPVDHLHPALEKLGAAYAVNCVEVRPGFPMLLATLPGDRPAVLAGLPGNPQSAVVALVTLVAPMLAGMTGRALRDLPTIELGTPIPGRGSHTHLSLVRAGEGGRAEVLTHAASSMLRGLARSLGFAVIAPGATGSVGDVVPLVPLPMLWGESWGESS